MSVVPFRWRSGALEVLDQRLLPHTIRHIVCRTPEDVAEAIRSMAVRGAPAIGCVAAYGMALAAKLNPKSLKQAAHLLKVSRPTAVNLAWAVERMLRAAKNFGFRIADFGFKDGINFSKNPQSEIRNPKSLFATLLSEAQKIEREDVAANRAMGAKGAKLFRRRSVILTHCNAGALATAGFGTALGVIRQAHKHGRVKKVLVDETRPYLQGARLTAWELVQEKIPHELITDNMAAHMMKTEQVSAVIVGCDRVAANGDTANKIGTYGLAVLAKHHKIPFYVAMPTSTLDLSLKTGAEIPIEDRSSEEVVTLGKIRIAPRVTRARHPAFDVTPADLITAIVTEKGIVRAPYVKNLRRLKS